MIEQKFQEFKKTYEDAVNSIHEYLTNDDLSDMKHLVEWMLVTDEPPCGYVRSRQFNGDLDSAEKFAAILSEIHHAVYDDGDIAFVTVDGKPRIVLADRYEEDFIEHVLSELEKQDQVRVENGRAVLIKPTYDIKILHINANEFGKVFDEWHIKDTKDWFIKCAAMYGLEMATATYSRSRLWNQDWPNEFKDEIDQRSKFWDSIRGWSRATKDAPDKE